MPYNSVRGFFRKERDIVPDIRVENHGSIFLLRAVTEAGDSWLREHTPAETLRFGRNATVVEPRYVQDIVNGARESGLEVQ